MDFKEVLIVNAISNRNKSKKLFLHGATHTCSKSNHKSVRKSVLKISTSACACLAITHLLVLTMNKIRSIFIMIREDYLQSPSPVMDGGRLFCNNKRKYFTLLTQHKWKRQTNWKNS